MAQVSNYAKRMGRLSARIFGEVVRPTNSQSMKVVKMFAAKPINKTPELVEYYPKHPQISILMKKLYTWGLYRDEHLDFKYEMRRLRELRGKVKPKKGEGKRAQKRK